MQALFWAILISADKYPISPLHSSNYDEFNSPWEHQSPDWRSQVLLSPISVIQKLDFAPPSWKTNHHKFSPAESKKNSCSSHIHAAENFTVKSDAE
jgi:hypothetical protein